MNNSTNFHSYSEEWKKLKSKESVASSSDSNHSGDNGRHGRMKKEVGHSYGKYNSSAASGFMNFSFFYSNETTINRSKNGNNDDSLRLNHSDSCKSHHNIGNCVSNILMSSSSSSSSKPLLLQLSSSAQQINPKTKSKNNHNYKNIFNHRVSSTNLVNRQIPATTSSAPPPQQQQERPRSSLYLSFDRNLSTHSFIESYVDIYTNHINGNGSSKSCVSSSSDGYINNHNNNDISNNYNLPHSHHRSYTNPSYFDRNNLKKDSSEKNTSTQPFNRLDSDQLIVNNNKSTSDNSQYSSSLNSPFQHYINDKTSFFNGHFSNNSNNHSTSNYNNHNRNLLASSTSNINSEGNNDRTSLQLEPFRENILLNNNDNTHTIGISGHHNHAISRTTSVVATTAAYSDPLFFNGSISQYSCILSEEGEQEKSGNDDNDNNVHEHDNNDSDDDTSSASSNSFIDDDDDDDIQIVIRDRVNNDSTTNMQPPLSPVPTPPPLDSFQPTTSFFNGRISQYSTDSDESENKGCNDDDDDNDSATPREGSEVKEETEYTTTTVVAKQHKQQQVNASKYREGNNKNGISNTPFVIPPRTVANPINININTVASKNSNNNSSRHISSTNIQWSDVKLPPLATTAMNKIIIGSGSYGTVLRGFIKRPNTTGTVELSSPLSSARFRNSVKRFEGEGNYNDSQKDEYLEVAVKVFTRNNNLSQNDYTKLCESAYKEVRVIRKAQSRMLHQQLITNAYGLITGPLSPELTGLFGLRTSTEGVGIVLRYEAGGSLQNYLSSRRNITLYEKCRILTGISRGLTELHALGIVHSDIKQENVLLSAHQPYPQVRLADFGFAAFGDNSVFMSNSMNNNNNNNNSANNINNSMNGSNGSSNKLGYSSLAMTNVRKGTPIYLAPELLSNPYQQQQQFNSTSNANNNNTNANANNKVIAKSSRKTDMYAFALLTWEVFSQTQAYSDVQSEGELCVRVHSGNRPPPSLLPHILPVPLKQMIQYCWDTQRAKRKTACECLVLLQLYTALLKESSINNSSRNSNSSTQENMGSTKSNQYKSVLSSALSPSAKSPYKSNNNNNSNFIPPSTAITPAPILVYDVYYSYDKTNSNNKFGQHLLNHLVRLGYSVWYNHDNAVDCSSEGSGSNKYGTMNNSSKEDSDDDDDAYNEWIYDDVSQKKTNNCHKNNTKNSKSNITIPQTISPLQQSMLQWSKVFIACADTAYYQNPLLWAELSEAKRLSQSMTLTATKSATTTPLMVIVFNSEGIDSYTNNNNNTTNIAKAANTNIDSGIAAAGVNATNTSNTNVCIATTYLSSSVTTPTTNSSMHYRYYEFDKMRLLIQQRSNKNNTNTTQYHSLFSSSNNNNNYTLTGESLKVLHNIVEPLLVDLTNCGCEPSI